MEEGHNTKMINEIKKTQKSLILEDIRELSTNSNWIQEQLKQLESFVYNPFECLSNYDENFKGKLKIEETRSLEESIDLIYSYYSDLVDDKKLSKKMISMFGFNSERTKAGSWYYPSSYSLKKIIKELTNPSPTKSKKDLISSFYQELRIYESMVPNYFDYTDLLEQVNLNDLLEIHSQRWFKSPKISMNVYYDAELKKLYFGSVDKKESILLLGKFRISITQSGSKTPMLNSFLSNKKDKVLARMEKEISKMMENLYTEFLGKKVSISDIVSGDSISPFVSEEEIQTFVKNNIEDLKGFYKSCMIKEKEKVFELIKSELGISD